MLVNTTTKRHGDCALGFCGNTNVVLESNLDTVHYVASISTFLSHHACIIAFWAFSVNRNACCKNTTKVLLFVTLKSSTFCYFDAGSQVLLSTHMKDLYHHIYDGEIFQKTSCIWHENTLMDFFKSMLINLGYSPRDDIKKVWHRGDKTVVVCFADDIYTCRIPRSSASISEVFDSNTVVITDNRVLWPTTYQVLQLPETYFGIYNYRPQQQEWQPDRRFNFSVNRLDGKRMTLFLELISRTLKPNSRIFDLERDYVNFNCWHWSSTNDSTQAFQQNFKNEFQFVPDAYQKIYQTAYDHMLPLMPYRNHNLEFEQSQYQVWMNIVLETYSSESVVALSEKTFRALVTPVPWASYSSRHTIAYLKGLGFDVMPDLVDHTYDHRVENELGKFGDKLVDFYYLATTCVDKLKTQDFDTIKNRCLAAANHNQKLLAKMQSQWPVDLSQWLVQAIEKIK